MAKAPAKRKPGRPKGSGVKPRPPKPPARPRKSTINRPTTGKGSALPKNADGTAKRGPGRPKGSRDKIASSVKEMIEKSLTKAGGVDYLLQQSKDNPVAYLSLIKTVVPKTIEATIDPSDGLTELLKYVADKGRRIHDK